MDKIHQLEMQIKDFQIELEKEKKKRENYLNSNFIKATILVERWNEDEVNLPDFCINLKCDTEDWGDDGSFYTIWCETEEQANALKKFALSIKHS